MGDAIELKMLEKGECLRLLGEQGIGRVVFTDAAMPAAQPVNYLLDGTEVVFRTGRGSKLAAAMNDAVVAFEVDEIDPHTQTGWSVLGVGQAYEIMDPARRARLERLVPRPWAPHRTTHMIAIPLDVLSGRRLSVAGWVSDALCTEPV